MRGWSFVKHGVLLFGELDLPPEREIVCSCNVCGVVATSKLSTLLTNLDRPSRTLLNGINACSVSLHLFQHGLDGQFPGYPIQLALDTVCSPYNNEFVSWTAQWLLDNFYKHVLQLTSVIATWFFIPVIILFLSRSNSPTICGLTRLQSDWHKSTYVKTCTSADRIEIEIWSRFDCN